MFLRAKPWMVLAPALLWLAGCAAVERSSAVAATNPPAPTTEAKPVEDLSFQSTSKNPSELEKPTPVPPLVASPPPVDKPAAVTNLVAAVEPTSTIDGPLAITPDQITAPAEVSPPSPEVKKTKPKSVSTSPKKPRAATTSEKKVIHSAKQEMSWESHLAVATGQLEQTTANSPTTSAEIAQHVALRMMYLMAGRRDDAVRPINGIPAAQQDFWSKELAGLATYLDTDQIPEANRRAAEATIQLHGAAANLGDLATLQIRNPTFCSEVTSYGVYEPFATREFQPGQELLLYAELENFMSEQTERGYHTALKAAYQLLDEHGQRVDAKDFPLTEEYCRNPRRDFFVRYFVWLPKEIKSGAYTLQLSVEDTLCQKLGQATIELNVVAAEKRDSAPAYPISPK